MPTQQELNNRANARALRKANREGNVERAQQEAVTQSVTSEQNEQRRTETQTAVDAGRPDPHAKPVPSRKATRAQQAAVGKKAAERQAQTDAERSPAPVDLEAEVSKWDGVGQPPLHLLNAAAERLDRDTRDEGKEIGSAAGKAAYETYLGKFAGKRNRHARVRAQQQAGEDAIARRAAETKSA